MRAVAECETVTTIHVSYLLYVRTSDRIKSMSRTRGVIDTHRRFWLILHSINPGPSFSHGQCALLPSRLLCLLPHVARPSHVFRGYSSSFLQPNHQSHLMSCARKKYASHTNLLNFSHKLVSDACFALRETLSVINCNTTYSHTSRFASLS